MKKINKKLKIIIFVIFILFILLMGYNYFFNRHIFDKIDAKCYNPLFNKPKLDEINVKLKYFHQGQFAGMYVANEKGFYKDEDLKVKLIPYLGIGNLSDRIIDSVVSGKTDFGVIAANDLILARAEGIKIKAIAVIYKESPICAYSIKSKNITRPEQFVGKTLGLENAQDIKNMYYSLMEKLNVNRSLINEVEVGWAGNEILNKEIDISTGYSINEPYYIIKEGYDVNIILLGDYGLNTYADVIFATEDTIKNKPELTERFLRATLKGWLYAIENKHEAVDATLKYSANAKDHELYMIERSIPRIKPNDKPIGWMEKSEWDNLQQIMLEQNKRIKDNLQKELNKIAVDIRNYIKMNPKMTISNLQADLEFNKIAIQTIGKTGYTMVADSTTGSTYLHPFKELINVDINQYKKYPELYNIIKSAIGTKCKDVEGFYSFPDKSGNIKQKYVQIKCIDAKTADNKSIYVAATTFIDEDNELILEKGVNIEDVFTMEFLEKIYGSK